MEKLKYSLKSYSNLKRFTNPFRQRGSKFKIGKVHPVSQVIDEISCIFSEIGFSVEEGPDVENEYNNFTALNTPENHPANVSSNKRKESIESLIEARNLSFRYHMSPLNHKK